MLVCCFNIVITIILHFFLESFPKLFSLGTNTMKSEILEQTCCLDGVCGGGGVSVLALVHLEFAS